MGDVHVYLEEGFDHDRVLVVAGGASLEEPDVTTRHQVGLAGVVDLEVPDGGPVAVSVAVPDRDLAAAVTVDAAATPHLRVNVVDGALVVRADGSAPMFA